MRRESSLAIQWHWGVSVETVWAWRKALGVERFTAGSLELRGQLNQEIAEGRKGIPRPAEQVEGQRQTILEKGLKPVRPYINGRAWTDEEKALVGTMADAKLAKLLDRTPAAIRDMRVRLGLPLTEDKRAPRWTEEELALLGTIPDDELAARFGRNIQAVYLKRHNLGIPLPLDRRRKENQK